MRATLAAGALFAAMLVCESTAQAGNADSFYFSDEAAMTAGAVVSNTRDAGSIWYNPAGLGGNTRGELNFNGTALGIRLRNVHNALGTVVPGSPGSHPNSLDSADFFSTPHTLTFIRNISPKLSAGFGLYVTALDLRNAESQQTFAGTAPVPPGSTVATTYTQRLDYAFQSAIYHAGPAAGYQVQPNLRVGAAVFGTYGKVAGFSQYVLGFNDAAQPPVNTGALLVQNRELFTYIGLQAAAGVQFDPRADWHLGLLVRSPEFLITSSGKGAGILVQGVKAPAQPGVAAFALVNPQSPFDFFNIVSPMRVIASVAHDFAPRTWIGAEADFQTGVSTSGIDGVFTVNARIGGRYALTEKLGIGAGLFTDRTTNGSVPATLGGDHVDYYGLTGGVELRTPLNLREKEGPNSIVLSTTLAIRYAIGLGSSRGADIDLAGGPDPPARVVAVTYHEIIPYIGSGVLF